jgi:translation initiation factor IF-3
MRRRNRSRPARDNSGPRVNDRIRVPRVILVDEDGKRLGEFLTQDALQFAQDRGLDLIEVAPNERPPICKVGDWGKIKYARKKAAQQSRKNASQPAMKELKVRPKTDDHDIEFKIKHAQKFLDRGDRVKITVWFRGREHAHHDVGAAQCHRIYEGVEDIARIERPPHMEGRRMHMILAPAKEAGGNG